MHELSVCRSVARIVADRARGRRVERVILRIGHLRQVVPDTLRWSWEAVVDGTPLEGSVIEIDHVPAVLRCRTCGADTAMVEPCFRCPCGSADTEITSGEELLVVAIDVVAA